jgi:hypothetical protein
MNIELEHLLTDDQASAIIGIKPETLRQWRTRRKKPLRYVRAGRTIRYRPQDIKEFIDHCVVDPSAKTSRAMVRKTA